APGLLRDDDVARARAARALRPLRGRVLRQRDHGQHGRRPHAARDDASPRPPEQSLRVSSPRAPPRARGARARACRDAALDRAQLRAALGAVRARHSRDGLRDAESRRHASANRRGVRGALPRRAFRAAVEGAAAPEGHRRDELRRVERQGRERRDRRLLRRRQPDEGRGRRGDSVGRQAARLARDDGSYRNGRRMALMNAVTREIGAVSAHLNEVYPMLPFTPLRGEGVWLEDAAGRRVLDLYGGHAVAALGYAHPELTEAIARQSSALVFQTNALPLAVRDAAAEALAAFGPEGLGRVFFVNSGAEANENALRLAFRVTGRKKVVAV